MHVCMCIFVCVCVCVSVYDGMGHHSCFSSISFFLFFCLHYTFLLFSLLSLSPLLTLPVFSTFLFCLSPHSRWYCYPFFLLSFSLCSCTQKQPFSPTLPLVLPTLPPFTPLIPLHLSHTPPRLLSSSWNKKYHTHFYISSLPSYRCSSVSIHAKHPYVLHNFKCYSNTCSFFSLLFLFHLSSLSFSSFLFLAVNPLHPTTGLFLYYIKSDIRQHHRGWRNIRCGISFLFSCSCSSYEAYEAYPDRSTFFLYLDLLSLTYCNHS